MTNDNRTNEPTEAQVEAAAKVIAGAAEGDAFYEYPFAEWRREEFRDKARAALVAAQGAAPQATVDELIETKAGLLLAHSSFDEGASAMLHSINQTQPGDEWSRPENPYWKALGPVLTAERALTAVPKPARDIHEPSHDRVYCVRCGGNWPCQPAPVLPSSTVDEGDLAKVIHGAACGPECTDDAPMRMDYRIARAVVEAIGGESRAARE